MTALPVNDAVQVKGLFINPPGNIWTGFHTTFEGENKVFQKTKIPYYLQLLKDSSEIVTATILNDNKGWINTIQGNSLKLGLNYLTWNLDEKSADFPGSSTGAQKISVLPGKYHVVINYGGAIDTTSVNVIPDPRFKIAPEVDIELYKFRKTLDTLVWSLSKGLQEVDTQKGAVVALKKQLDTLNGSRKASLLKRIDKMEASLDQLRATGQTPKPKRQVGAWQSFETTPFSKLQELLMVAEARTTPLSKQHLTRVGEVKELIAQFNTSVQKFKTDQWNSFQEKIKKSEMVWDKAWD